MGAIRLRAVLTIRPNKLVEFKKLVADMVALVSSEQCVTHEYYASSEAVMEHAANAGHLLARLGDLTESSPVVELYGGPSREPLDLLTQNSNAKSGRAIPRVGRDPRAQELTQFATEQAELNWERIIVGPIRLAADREFRIEQRSESIEINIGTDYIFRYTWEIDGAKPHKPSDSNRGRSAG